MRKYLLIGLLGLYLPALQAQMQWQVGLHCGSTLRIHPQYPALPQAAWAIEVNRYRPLPAGLKAGVQLSVASPGNPDALGQLWGLTGSLDRPLWRRPRGGLRVAFHTGLARLTRPYHRIHHPANTALAARWVNLTLVKLYAYRKLGAVQAQAGVAFWHYSSAKARVPNLGINLVMGYLALRPATELTPPARVEASPLPRWQGGLRLGAGRTSRKVAGGPQYWVAAATLWGSYRWRPRLRVMLGSKVFFEESLVAFFRDQDFGLAQPARSAVGVIAFTGVELLIGRLGVRAWLGPYLRQPVLMPYRLYTELGLHYYLRHDRSARCQPFLGVGVHAHAGEADFGEWGLGLLF